MEPEISVAELFQQRFHLNDFIGFNHVALFDVVEILDGEAALEAGSCRFSPKATRFSRFLPVFCQRSSRILRQAFESQPARPRIGPTDAAPPKRGQPAFFTILFFSHETTFPLRHPCRDPAFHCRFAFCGQLQKVGF